MKLPQKRGGAMAVSGLTDKQLLWRAKNRNAIRGVANKFDLSYTFVRKVFQGELSSGDRRVEKEFAKLGCPGFEERANAA